MAFVAAPGVAQIRLTGLVGAHPWAVVLHWYTGSATAWTQSQIQSLAQSCATRWDTNIKPLLGNNTRGVASDTVDLSDSTLRAGHVDSGNATGGTPNPTPTLASCILISHKTSQRYRGGHARTYLPGSGSANTADGDTWGAGFVATCTTNWTAFKNGISTDMQAAGLSASVQCAPRYTYLYEADANKHKFIKTKQTFLSPNTVTGFVVQNQIATQRRRLG